VDFDPGPGTFDLTASGSQDAFISKLDRDGRFLWAGRFGGTAETIAGASGSVALDAGGNVYIVGNFSGTTDFDPGTGTLNLTAALLDAFVAKPDSDGNLIWAGQLGGASNNRAHHVAVDAGGHVYTVGRAGGPADFDPGPGTFSLTAVTGALLDGFISKLDSAGTFVWAGQLGGTGPDGVHGIAIDGSGNIYISGFFSTTAGFDPGPGTFTNQSIK